MSKAPRVNEISGGDVQILALGDDKSLEIAASDAAVTSRLLAGRCR